MTTKHNIGEMIRIIIHTDGLGEPRLVIPKDKYKYHDNELTFYKVLIVGRDQRDNNLAVLVDKDIDPHGHISKRIEQHLMQSYDIAQKYANQWALFITQKHVYVATDLLEKVEQVHLKEPGGTNCIVCKKYIQYASGNRADGTYVCYNCNETKSWLIPEIE